MSTMTDPQIEMLSESCVNDMGDIFWDFDPSRDTVGQYSDPREVALRAIQTTLREFAEHLDSTIDSQFGLVHEYRSLIDDLGEDSSDDGIVGALVRHTACTHGDARDVLQVARRHGIAFLRNALALAEALNVEKDNTDTSTG